MPPLKESKPGVQTTEFWLVLLSNVLVQLEAVPVPDRWKAPLLILSVVGYSLSRGIAKQGMPAETKEVYSDEDVDEAIADEKVVVSEGK